ncbi:MAG: translation elongation factor Ts [Ignavibacteria bacterium]|nr:translation elongation factor Ts [Ignavibacteria bacterium]
MAEITSKMVVELREKTGAGMGDCKKALQEADGDFQLAIEILRKKGAASAEKRAGREAKEGIIATAVSPDNKIGAIVEVNCETDFVARNENFVNYSELVAKTLLNNNVTTIEELFQCKVNGETLQDFHNEILAKFQENIRVRRIKRIETSGYISHYVHAGSKLGVLVVYDFDKKVELPDDVKTSLRDIAMQVAAMNPMFIDRESVPQEVIDKEIEIYKEQAINEGKKPEIAEKIAQGRLSKFFNEQCLLEQTFIKDGNLSVREVLNNVENTLGCKVKISQFVRYYLGEVE